MTWRRVKEAWACSASGVWHPVAAAGTPGPGSQAPSTPTGLDYTSTQTSVTLTWDASTAPSGGSVDYYEVTRNGTIIGRPGGLTLTATGLAADTGYVFAVRAVSGAGVPSAWSDELVARTKATTPPPGGTLFGFSTALRSGESRAQGITRVSALLGVPRVYRYYLGSGALTWPTSQMGQYASVPLAISHKPYPPSSVTNGSWDARIAAFLAQCPTNRPTWYLCFDHELDSKVNKGQYGLNEAAAAWNYIAAKVKAYGNPLIRTCMLLTGFSSNTRYRQWAAQIDPDLVDTIGADPYAAGATTAAAAISRYNALYDDIAAAFPGKHVVIGETGTADGTEAQRKAWITGAVQAIHNHAATTEVASYFHSTVGGNFELDDYPDAATPWREATEAA